MRKLGLLLAAAAGILGFVALAGPAMLMAVVPLLSLLPPGVLLQFATGFATTGPLQTGAGLAGLLLGRIVVAHPALAMGAAALATVSGFAWELAEVGASTVIATGVDFVLGRVIGLAAGIVASAGACRLGIRWAKGLALPTVGLASRRRAEER
ncbi:hypothetical protein [Vulgatibacter sp.]|uniref:hypothetical protein n=1 Tax=Vulgatibacter sp. TaxID=1971226 RepID=UPI00356ADF0F